MKNLKKYLLFKLKFRRADKDKKGVFYPLEKNLKKLIKTISEIKKRILYYYNKILINKPYKEWLVEKKT